MFHLIVRVHAFSRAEVPELCDRCRSLGLFGPPGSFFETNTGAFFFTSIPNMTTSREACVTSPWIIQVLYLGTLLFSETLGQTVNTRSRTERYEFVCFLPLLSYSDCLCRQTAAPCLKLGTSSYKEGGIWRSEVLWCRRKKKHIQPSHLYTHSFQCLCRAMLEMRNTEATAQTEAKKKLFM